MMLYKYKRTLRFIAVFLAFNLMVEYISPLAAYALTGGPSQPEVQSFEPVGTTENVDIFSGDFVYNIPLLDVGGYPINISYHGGIGMEQEASWVGLGWNINPGVINRSMRGIPDEFNGTDKVVKKMNMRPNRTYSVDMRDFMNLYKEKTGVPVSNGIKTQYDFGIFYNNYKGIGYEFGLSYSTNTKNKGWTGRGSINYNSQNSSIDISPNILFNSGGDALNYAASFGGSYSRSSGINYLNMGSTLSGQVKGKEHKNSGMGRLNGSYIGYVNPSYVPVSNPNMYSASYDLNVKIGHIIGESFQAQPISVGYNEIGIRSDYKSKEYPAYGYMYSGKALEDNQALMDFNREKDMSPSKYIRRLAVPQITHDIYSVSGQGSSGMFRPFYNSVGTVADPEQTIIGMPPIALGFELGLGNEGIGQVGIDIRTSNIRSRVGKWKGEGVLENLDFAQKANDDFSDYENWHFKNMGEKVQADEAYHGAMGNTVTSLDLQNYNSPSGTVSASPVTQKIKRTKRALRNQPMLYKTASESPYCVSGSIESYGWDKGHSGNILTSTKNVTNRTSNYRRSHHISEMTSINPDGTRYVYGIPTYNTYQKDATFAIHKKETVVNRQRNNICKQGGMFQYATTDASENNNLGIDNYFQSTEIPAYAHSYLLTSVLSPDYVDLSTNGPTPDDLGSYTKINYSLHNAGFKWRSPYSKNLTKSGTTITGGVGAFVEGYMSDPTDDKVAYTYGTKEVWYMHSIETKTHVAIFILSDREDGIEAASEHGGIGSTKLKQLDKIMLFTREEYQAHSNDILQATPLKTVHFKYDYSLCPNVPNNSGAFVADPDNSSVNLNAKKGKLTLKKVWFTYGKSSKSALSPYEFTYSSTNPDYDMNAMDGWGNYKKSVCNAKTNTNNKDFPYVEQNKTLIDQNSSAWNLTQIKLPSGGKITVNYESDDYAYVQNKPAMQMFKILGMGESDDFSQSDRYLYADGLQKRTHRFLFFEIPDGATPESCYPNANPLYFKFLVDMDSRSNYEFVRGYLDPETAPGKSSYIGAATGTGGRNIGWIYVKEGKVTFDVHPVSLAAWQLTKLDMPHLIFPGMDASKMNSFEDKNIISGLYAAIPKTASTILGINTWMMTRKFAQKVLLDACHIRLQNPVKKKMAGGNRVKSITFSDEWSAMTGSSEETFISGIKYDYTMEENGQTISSGVATYEPLEIGEENPFHEPEVYEQEVPLAINNKFYQEKPFGESYFPGPSVGYRKVTVKNLGPDDLYPGQNYSIKRHTTGYSVYEFYTSYDFPVLVTETTVSLKKSPGLKTLSLLGINLDYRTMSQGYQIKLNDMNGKPKSKSDYSATDAIKPLSKVEYFYKVKDQNAVHKELDNKVTVLYKDGTLAKDIVVGEDMEQVYDNRENESLSRSGAIEANVIIPKLPVFIPVIMGSPGPIDHKRLRTSSSVKVIHSSGLLEKIKVHEEGATIETQNLAYDPQTGEVLLSKTETEFSDHVYKLNYPSHWAYDGMGPASKNFNYNFELESSSAVQTGGYATISKSVFDILSEGDVLHSGPWSASKPTKIWLLKKKIEGGDPCTGSTPVYKIVLIDEKGKPVPAGDYNLTVKIPGRKNMQGLSIGAVTSKGNPMNTVAEQFGRKTDFSQVLNASAVEFSDEWQTYDDRELFTRPATFYQTGFSTLFPFFREVIKGNVFTQDFTDITTYAYSTEEADKATYQAWLAAKAPTRDPSYISWDVTMVSPGVMTINLGGICTFTITSVGGTDNDFSELNSGNMSAMSNEYNVAINTSTLPWIYSYNFKIGSTHTYKVESNECGALPYISCDYGVKMLAQSKMLGQEVNPFRIGVKGNWRPKKSYTYYDRRNNTALEFKRASKDVSSGIEREDDSYQEMPVRDYGLIQDFHPFWNRVCTLDKKFSAIVESNPYSYDPWISNSEVTLFSPYGFDLENKDALSIYSAAVYGYNNTLPIAVGKNTKLNEIGYDNFEQGFNVEKGPETYHLRWMYNFSDDSPYSSGGAKKATQSTDKAHSGLYALKITPDGRIPCISELDQRWDTYTNSSSTETFKLQEQHLINTFSPTKDKTYYISYWVNEQVNNDHTLQLTYSNPGSGTDALANLIYQVHSEQNDNIECAQEKINFTNKHLAVYYYGLYDASYPNFWLSLTPSSITNDEVTVDGWKKKVMKFTVPASAKDLRMVFVNNSGTNPIYIDDFRIYPENSTMKSFAYHPVNRRLMAELDENNFATFYEYDEEGNLVRVKKETEKGIMTLQENRQNIKK